MPQKNSSDKLTGKDYEHLGRSMVAIYETGFLGRKRFYIFTFVRGVIMGFGTVVGATIIVALAIWVLSWFSTVPLIDSVRDALQVKQQ